MVKKMKKTKIIHKDNGDVLFEPKIDTDTLEIGNDLPTFLNEADALASKIWNTNVGQSFKTDMGHIISIAGKSRAGHVMLGAK